MAVSAPGHIIPAQFDQLRANGLEQGGNTDRLVYPGANVGDSKLQGVELGVGADIPPYLGCWVAFAKGSYSFQRTHVGLILTLGVKGMGNTRSRQHLKYHATVRLEAGIITVPER